MVCSKEEMMAEKKTLTLNFFEHLDAVKKNIAGKEIVLFLDYDGTLAPIAPTPDLAVISESMRRIIQKAADMMTVSIVSGRATDDVRAKLKIDGLFYAGSHGFEIVDPKGAVTVNEEAQMLRGTIDEAYDKLSRRLEKFNGALVEHVKYTISVHYRLVSAQDFPKVEKSVNDILEEYPVLRKTGGKKVFEIRPKIDWDKGRAVQRILKFLKYDPARHVPVYVGDDVTDEDAFHVLKDNGLGILVAGETKSTEAKYIINDTEEVGHAIEFFMEASQK